MQRHIVRRHRHKANLGFGSCLLGLVSVAMVLLPSARPVHAQLPPPGGRPSRRTPDAAPPARPPAAGARSATPAAKKEAKEQPPPAPEPVFLDTKDGWTIHCLYYAPKEGIREGEKTVPIIMLHGWEGQGSEYSYLATGLQTYGHACIVPDLRDHGRSKGFKDPRKPAVVQERDARRWETLEKQAREETRKLKYMVQDVETIKKFLVQKNNAGEVNIDLLCVIAAEEGCLVALQWAILDWNAPPTLAGKQGQDVKALVLLSPKRSFEGIPATAALRNPVISQRLSLMFAVGENDRRTYSEVKRMYDPIERIRPPVVRENKDLFLATARTELQGTKLLDRALPINQFIAGFLKLRLVNQADKFPWTKRKSPVSGD